MLADRRRTPNLLKTPARNQAVGARGFAGWTGKILADFWNVNGFESDTASGSLSDRCHPVQPEGRQTACLGGKFAPQSAPRSQNLRHHLRQPVQIGTAVRTDFAGTMGLIGGPRNSGGSLTRQATSNSSPFPASTAIDQWLVPATAPKKLVRLNTPAHV